MDLETVTAKVTPRPRNRMGGPPWSPETRARYTATIAANRAARAPAGQPTDRACVTPECTGRVPLRFKGQGPQRRDCDACRARRTTGRRRTVCRPPPAPKVPVARRERAPSPVGEPDAAHEADDIAPDDEDAELEDVEALLDTTYPADLVEQRAAKPTRRKAAERPPRETVQPEGSWWMQVPSGKGFTALAESRRSEMAKGKGAKIASQMDNARREP